MNPGLQKRLQILFLLGSTSTKEVKVSAVTQFHTKGVWHSGRVVDCNPEGRGIEARWSCFWWFISRKVDGKLSENSFAGEQKTVGKFWWFRNIPSSSLELVGLTRSSCQKSFPSPLQVSLLHPVRLAEFSVNFFFSAIPFYFSYIKNKKINGCFWTHVKVSNYLFKSLLIGYAQHAYTFYQRMLSIFLHALIMSKINCSYQRFF